MTLHFSVNTSKKTLVVTLVTLSSQWQSTAACTQVKNT